jgi:hypothetical protein
MGTACQSDGSRRPASTEVGGLHADGTSSGPHTRTLTVALSRDIKGSVGQRTNTDSVDSMRPDVSVPWPRATSIS